MAVCDRFGCLPSAALAESVEVLEFMRIEQDERADAVVDEGW